MTAFCQPLPVFVIEDLFRDVARSLCERPADTTAEREVRIQRMVHTALGFQPRDGMEYMLTTMTMGHFDLIMDSMHDVFQGQLDTMKTRTKSGIVALGRSMLGLARELRTYQARPLVENVSTGMAAAAEPVQPPAAAASPEVSPPEIVLPEIVFPEIVSPEAVLPEIVSEANPAPISPPVTPAPSESGTLEEHVAAFQAAFAAMAETLEEARAHDRAQAKAGGEAGRESALPSEAVVFSASSGRATG